MIPNQRINVLITALKQGKVHRFKIMYFDSNFAKIIRIGLGIILSVLVMAFIFQLIDQSKSSLVLAIFAVIELLIGGGIVAMCKKLYKIIKQLLVH